MRLTKQTSYALRILIHCALSGGKHVKAADIAAEHGIGDVIRATEATHVEAECVGGTTLPCGIKRAAPINRMLGEAVEAFIEVLDKHTLADLIVARPREAVAGAGALRRARVASTASH